MRRIVAQILTFHFYKVQHDCSYFQMVRATTWEYLNVLLILFLFHATVQLAFSHQHREQVVYVYVTMTFTPTLPTAHLKHNLC